MERLDPTAKPGAPALRSDEVAPGAVAETFRSDDRE